ncbi:MAG TPA: amidohydrolase family protein [Longimicrobiales bacterium]|nr:amidohydrolase family protein [Longimicrobiales bacterium]
MLRQSLKATLTLLAAAGTFAAAARAQTPATPQTVAFLNANVIPMDRERVLLGQTVIVSNGVVIALGPDGTVKVPAGALRIDAAGRYLLPALADMHVHLLNDAWKMMLRPEALAASKVVPDEQFLFPYLANGVTTVQVLSATPEDLAVRERIRRGELLGPRMILAPMIDGPKKAWPPPISIWVGDAAEARAAVVKAKRDGHDKIKAYSFLSRESYDAIVAAAKEEKMDVIGHVPMALSVEYVIDAGQTLIAHSEELGKHAKGDYSAERIEYFADLMVRRDVWLIPTLVTSHSIFELVDDPAAVLGRPEAVYFQHAMEQGVWSFIADNLYLPMRPQHHQSIRDGYEKFQRPLTKLIHDKGGKLLAGSDAPLPGLVPGFALHRELRELVDVGLTPFAALRTSTTAPFEYLGESERAGTIAPGQHSDLLLVDANPLEDISALSHLSGVLLRGRWIGKAEIQRRMQQMTH